MNSNTAFAADLARFNDMFAKADAIRTDPTDGYQWIDPTKVSASFMGTYQRLMQFGYANGLI